MTGARILRLLRGLVVLVPLRGLAVLVLAAAPGTIAAPAAHGGQVPHPALFGSQELRSADLSMFPKWRGALARHFAESGLENGPCSAVSFNLCHLAEWTRFLDGLRGSGKMHQIRAVNDFLNRRGYVIDPLNYGVSDYWASPRQFLALDGDCEDYAIAKYFSLRALGFAADEIRILVLQDLNLNTAHAVLVVYIEGRAMVLDNQVPAVVDARAITHYQPIYSINEQHWWLHRM